MADSDVDGGGCGGDDIGMHRVKHYLCIEVIHQYALIFILFSDDACLLCLIACSDLCINYNDMYKL